MIILDTNLVSETLRPQPDQAVAQWMASIPNSELFITAISAAELLYGVAILPPGRRRDTLGRRIEEILTTAFSSRMLPFDTDAAKSFAEIGAKRRRQGRPIEKLDAQIAAIVASKGATLATRNVRDFADCGIDLIDPWRVA